MEKRIALEKRGRPENQITELNLDNCRSTNFEGLTDDFVALESLSLINVGLVSLKNFPKLPCLKRLELSDNRISNGLNHLHSSPKLAQLNLSGNRIKEFDELKPLASLENLEIVDLFNNEVTAVDDYRDKIFELIPSLKYLDGYDKDDKEAPSDGEDDELNGNGTDDDDDNDVFCLNGLEIDLKELEIFERKLEAKRKDPNYKPKPDLIPADDDLDELLRLQNERIHACDQSNRLENGHSSCTAETSKSIADTNVLQQLSQQSLPSLPILMYTLLGMLSFLRLVMFENKNEDGEEGEEDDDEDFDEDDDENDVSLAEVYNDDLEEDNSDWNEEGEEGDEDDDEVDDEEDDEAVPKPSGGKKSTEEANAENVQRAADVEEPENEEQDEESPSRGKKRKHDG